VIRTAAHRARDGGTKVATAHLIHVNPLPANTGEVVRAYRKVLIPEMNLGQLAMIIRSRFLVDADSYCKVQGQPILTHELEEEILRRA
jgi:2-oxoglutarate ferredoxin oxidoreductase subunit alpha